MSGRLVLSVLELTRVVSGALAREALLEDVLVEGEVSNLRLPANGHLYFTLKDAQASVRCVCWQTHRLRIPFHPEDGMRVVAHGRVEVWPRAGTYQLYVDRIEPAGVGALALAVEQIAARLRAEGLFDEARKRPLPLLPRRVAVVTSPSGAAVRDVCTVARRRASQVDLVIVPTIVQGDGAEASIVAALQSAERIRDVDVILLVRGGGALEDLWAFQGERLARAIRATRVPVVTGIGHETDTTIADLAADRRAATPSAAAELVVPDAAALARDVAQRRERLEMALRGQLARRRRELEHLRVRLRSVSPAATLTARRQALELRIRDLRAGLLALVGGARRRLDQDLAGLERVSPVRRVERERLGLAHRLQRLETATGHLLDARRSRLAAARGRLEALSPRHVLRRGYSLTLDAATGRIVGSIAQLEPGRRLRTVLADGSALSTVEAVEPEGRAAGGERMYDNRP